MREGERGNLLVRARLKNRDEIGELGKSFNEMMEKVSQLVKQTNDSAMQVLQHSTVLLESSRKTQLSAKEINGASNEIAAGASSLADEAERGNELTTSIGEKMRTVTEANVRMSAAAESMLGVSARGIASMSVLTEKTSTTEQMTLLMVEKVGKLKESTSSVRNILEVLTKLTKQTNILSLNAAIEASRAGAAGKGFMVVAEEIRKLADQSRDSINVVGAITGTILAEIDETVAVLSEACPLFREQISSVKEADAIFNDVRYNMEQFVLQFGGVVESIRQLEQMQAVLSGAVSNVSAVSQQSSSTSEQVASLTAEQLNVCGSLVVLAEQLDSLSAGLRGSLSRFTVADAD